MSNGIKSKIANLTTESKEVVDDSIKATSYANNSVNAYNGAENLKKTDSSIKSYVDQTIATSSLGADSIGLVSTVNKYTPTPDLNVVKKLKPLATKVAPPLSIATGGSSAINLSTTSNEYGETKLSDSLNVASGILYTSGGVTAATGIGAVATPFLFGAGATVGVIAGLTNDITVNEALDFVNYLAVDGLGDLGDAISNKIINLFDPPEELPEISGSQQNQLMAISKGPSLNFTSHKKDSVAGYTLYQMLDNAEDTISTSCMNGFTVYVMGKTIQPTCKGDETGIGGGVTSGTVGKEIRATSGAPSIFYCGYMSIRADDTCTMNNENVDGKYISLC